MGNCIAPTHVGRRILQAVLVMTLVVAVVACVGAEEARSSGIVCSTSYRVSASEPFTDVDTLGLGDEDSTQSMPYIYLELHAQYVSGSVDGERAVRLWVTPTGEDDEIASQLYQLPQDQGPTDQFLGGHGFTGLNDVRDPVTGAELQYWCEAG